MNDDTVIEPPRRTDKPEEFIELSGKVMGWYSNTEQPVMIKVLGAGDRFYLPLFDDPEYAVKFLGHAGVVYGQAFTGFKQVSDGPEFLSEIPTEIGVMVNPWFTDEGKVRWTEVLR